MNREPAHSISKRGRLGEGRPTLYTPELANRLADHIAAGLTDEEAAALEDISCDCISRWRKSNPEFCVAIKKAEAGRLVLRLKRIEAGEQGWQGTAWALERLYPHRFARPEVMNQIAVVNQGDKVLPKGSLSCRGRSSTPLLTVQATTCARTETWSVGKEVLFM